MIRSVLSIATLVLCAPAHALQLKASPTLTVLERIAATGGSDSQYDGTASRPAAAIDAGLVRANIDGVAKTAPLDAPEASATKTVEGGYYDFEYGWRLIWSPVTYNFNRGNPAGAIALAFFFWPVFLVVGILAGIVTGIARAKGYVRE